MIDTIEKAEQSGRIPLGVGDAVPENMTSEEAAKFWDTHAPTADRIAAAQKDEATWVLMWEIAPCDKPQQSRHKTSHVTTLRLGADVEAHMKQVAAIKQMPYQTLLILQ